MAKKIIVKKMDQKKYCEEILCAGFGGQGIMFMGKLLAQAALMAGRYVTWMPSYGAEVRGGTAYSMVKISKKEIASPVVINPDMLVVMNRPSLIKYAGTLKDGSILLANLSLTGEPYKRKGITAVNIPMTGIASKLGDIRCANVIAVGALVKRSKMLSLANVLGALNLIMGNKKELFFLNKNALEKGYRTR